MDGQFPLFSHLKSEIHTVDPLSPTEKIALSDLMKELDDQGCSLVYALIRYYQIYEEKGCIVDTPFGMKKIKPGYRFCLDDMPVLLQNLLQRFVTLHLQTQKGSSS